MSNPPEDRVGKKTVSDREQGLWIAVAGLVLFLAVPVLWLLFYVRDLRLVLPASFGVILIGIGLFFYFKGGSQPVTDGRKWKIDNRALALSWGVTWILLIVLPLLRNAGLLSLSVDNILYLTWYSMPLTFIAFQVYLNRKGDVK